MSKTGRMIKSIRTAKGLTQTELAKKMGGYPVQFICAIESGRSNLPLKKIKALAKAFDVPERWIINFIVDDYFEKLKKVLK